MLYRWLGCNQFLTLSFYYNSCRSKTLYNADQSRWLLQSIYYFLISCTRPLMLNCPSLAVAAWGLVWWTEPNLKIESGTPAPALDINEIHKPQGTKGPRQLWSHTHCSYMGCSTINSEYLVLCIWCLIVHYRFFSWFHSHADMGVW